MVANNGPSTQKPECARVKEEEATGKAAALTTGDNEQSELEEQLISAARTGNCQPNGRCSRASAFCLQPCELELGSLRRSQHTELGFYANGDWESGPNEWLANPIPAAAAHYTEQGIASLLHHGVDVNCETIEAETAVIAAIRGQQFNVLKFLIAMENIDLGKTTRMGVFPLFAAVQLEWEDGVDALIHDPGRRVDINQVSIRGSALLEAIRLNAPVLIEKLITAGVDVNLADNVGTTPLMAAAETDNPLLIYKLVSVGADVSSVADDKSIVPEIEGSRGAATLRRLLFSREVEATLEESRERVSARMRELEENVAQEQEGVGSPRADAISSNEEKIAAIRAETASLREKFTSSAMATSTIASS